MVKRPILLIFLLGIASILSAQQSWEGLATVSRFGRFPAGLYGASNLVSPNSLVSVRNLETGLSERIIITDGVDEPGVFLVLSPEAAAILDVSGSGATRVRLTTIVSDTMPPDTASEQPFHPDPDINPAAGVGLDIILPGLDIAVEDEPVEDEPAEVVEAATTTEEPVEAVEEPVEEPVEVTVEPAITLSEPEATSTTTPMTTGRRSGIAAGVARTQVGRAQESFERPDTALETGRPEPIAEIPPEIGEPEVEPEEVATAGIATLDPVEETVPVVSAQPELPETEEPVIVETSTDATATDAASVEAVERPPTEEVPKPANPIHDAVAAAVNRIPPRDFFPPPVGEEGDLGFAGLNRPIGAEGIEVALAEADVPPVDRPELAGLAPLQAAPANLPASLAEAALPPEDLPEVAAFGLQTPPTESISGTLLPVARAEAEERPVVQDLPPYSAPGETLTSGALAEAAVAPLETPSSDAVAMVSPPTELVDGVLAEVGVAESERPELADIGPAETPASPPLEALLVEAEVVPRESPNSDAVEMVGAPAESVEAELAEAAVMESERSELTDVGPADVPTAEEVDAVLAEAAPEAEERPDDSLAAAEPAPAGEVSDVALEPEPGVEEILVVEESMEAPGDIPDDALLTLEPADFRPPEYPNPDDESLIDRETPAEEPEFVAVLETPDATRPIEEVEPIVVVEATVVDDRPEVVSRDLPVVSNLVDNNYYLQIGAYTVPATAQVAVDALSATYPMAVLPVDSHGTTVYRVLVGPLERDETGTLLLWLRAKGYRDTFIRSGTEL